MTGDHHGATRADLVRLFEGTSAASLTDGELLGRFASRGDASAFAALVDRLGPLVLGVCRRTLVDPHDVDDAFQATFLVLVRRAGSIGDREAVACWVYGVALRVARRARRDAVRRLARERRGGRPEARESTPDLEQSELRVQIDEEIGRLPDHQRHPVVLCDVEGLSREEAAARLGWTVNMVRGRLERARGRLRDRLTRRGLAPAGASGDLALPAIRPKPALVAATVRAALAVSIGSSGAAGLATASALSLSRGVIRMMIFSRWKLAATALLSTSAVVATGSGMLAAQGPGPDPVPVVRAPAHLTQPAADDPFTPRPAADLAKARVEAAKVRLVAQKAFYEEGRITVDRLINASRTFMEAERDAADSKAGRLAAVRLHHALLRDLLKRETAELEVGRATTADVSEVQSSLLEAEFALAREIEAPEVTSKPAPRSKAIADLRKARVDIARRVQANTVRLVAGGELGVDAILASSKSLMEAERDAADSKEGRVAAVRSQVEIARKYLAAWETLERHGEKTKADVDQARLGLIDAELALAREIGEGGIAVDPSPGGTLPTTRPASPDAKPLPKTSLGEAVRDFNALWSDHAKARDERLLTEDEVVAAIRLAERPTVQEVSDASWARFKRVAETRQAGPGVVLQAKLRTDPGGDFVYQGWWIQILIADEAANGNLPGVYPIRSRLERSFTLEEAIADAEASLRHPGIDPATRSEAGRQINDWKERIKRRGPKPPASS